MRSAKQRLIGSQGFQGSTLPAAIYPALSCNGLGPAAIPTLNSFGWSGKVISGIIFWLGPNNQSISRGSFFTSGNLLDTPYIVPAKKLWPNAADYISLSLPLASADLFSFPDSLASSYIEDLDVPHSFIFNDNRNSPPPTEEDLAAGEIGDFCLRAFAFPASSLFIRLYILIFPCSMETLTSHALYSNPKWPGLLIFDGQIPLFPPSSSKKVKYGCPFLPLLVPSSFPLSEGPPASDLTAKIASILRTGSLPESAISGEALMIRWLALDEEGARSLNSTLPPTLWPAPAISTSQLQGKSSSFLVPFLFFFLFIDFNFSTIPFQSPSFIPPPPPPPFFFFFFLLIFLFYY